MVPDEMSTVPIWVFKGSLAVQFIVLGAFNIKVLDTVVNFYFINSGIYGSLGLNDDGRILMGISLFYSIPFLQLIKQQATIKLNITEWFFILSKNSNYF